MVPRLEGFRTFDQPDSTAIPRKSVTSLAGLFKAGQPDYAHARGDGMEGPRDPLHPLAALLVIILIDVDVPIPKVLVEIVHPVARALAVGGGHEVQPGQGVRIFFALSDVYFSCERGGEQFRQTVRYLGPIRLAGDPHLAVPLVLEKPFGGSPADLQVGRSISLPVYIPVNDQ